MESERPRTLSELREQHALSMEELAQRIIKWLAENEGVQADLGPRHGANLSRMTINRWENVGVRSMRSWSKRALAGVYGVSIATIDAALMVQNEAIDARKRTRVGD